MGSLTFFVKLYCYRIVSQRIVELRKRHSDLVIMLIHFQNCKTMRRLQ
jgi:hypothetical protein